MFGFVTFVYAEMVQIILAKGNPHFVCDSRVLVKPYKEKAKLSDKKQQQLDRYDFLSCSSPSVLDGEPFEMHVGPRLLYKNQEMLKKKLEEVHWQQALELHRRRLMNLQRVDLKNHHYQHDFYEWHCCYFFRQVRNWMEEENLKFSEKKKEVKEKLLAAKEKEKLAKRKLQDEVVKSIIAKKGAPLSIAEHEALVSEMKAESERAQAEILETMGLVPKYENTPDAVRIKPVFIDSNGHACWRLKGCTKSDLLRQEIQGRGEPKASDKWFSYDEDKDIQVVNKYISISSVQRQKRSKINVLKVENGNLNPKQT